MNNTNIGFIKHSFLRPYSCLLLFVIISCLTVTEIGFFLKIHVGEFHLATSCFISCVLFYFMYRQNGIKYNITIISTTIITIVTFGLLGELTFDYSFDGQCYHQSTIHCLIKGWNPIYDHDLPEEGSFNIWTTHYAKGLEILSSLFATAFHSIESGKGANYLLVLIGFCHVLDVLINDFRLRNSKAISLAWLITLSPTVCAQVLTYYNDWALYVLLLIEFSELYKIYKKKHISYLNAFVICSIIILSFSTKFNHAFWVFYFLLLFSCYIAYKKQTSLIKKGVLIGLFGSTMALLISFNPYITNILNGHHILYPLMGGEKVDIMTSNTPEVYGGSNVANIFYSIFSRPSQTTLKFYMGNFAITCVFYIIIICFLGLYYKISKLRKSIRYIVIIGTLSFYPFAQFVIGNSNDPNVFSIYQSTVTHFQTDYRVGGFGYFFPEILMLSILIIATNYKALKTVGIICGFIFVGLFILPSGWWARYVPFLFLIPCIIILIQYESTIFKTMQKALIVLMVLNCICIIIPVITHSIQYTNYEKKILSDFKTKETIHINFNNNYGFKIKLTNNDIGFTEDSNKETMIELFPPVYIAEK